MQQQRGQALLLVILTMVIALTVGLSVATRSITTVRISTAEEESQRAFSAAEAGIEEVLKSGLAVGSSLDPVQLTNNARYYAAIITQTSNTDFLVPGVASKDEAVQIWLSSYPDYSSPYTGNVTVFWGETTESCDNVAALEVIIFSGTVNSPTVSRYALDPCTSRGNNFSAATGLGGTVQGVTFRQSHTISSISNGLIMRIIPLYKSARIAVRGSSSLPSQGREIESTGKVVSGTQEVVRKIRVFQSHPSLPSIFDHAIFSGTSL